MKNIILIITLLSINLVSCQIYPLNTSPSDIPDNAYIKDMNNSLGLPNSELPENKDIKGYMHTHVNDYKYINADGDEVTRSGIKIFSPADIKCFMEMIKNAQDEGRPLDDVYAIMISNNANYQIRFTGNQYQIKTFTEAQNNVFRDLYTEYMKDRIGNQKSLELGLLYFMSEKMNLKGVTLYRMDANGINKEIKLNANKTDTVESNCPN